MRRLLRYLMWTTIVLLVLGAIAIFSAYRASQTVPEFYELALSNPVPSDVAKVEGDRLERQVLELHDEVHREGTWEAVFTDEQLNAWFAVDLPEKYPKAMPDGVSQPRIKIGPEAVQIAATVDKDGFSTVVSASADLYLTDQPNELALRFREVRAGVLPLPLSQFLDRITKHARGSGLALRWTQEDGDPVALIIIPIRHDDYDHQEVYLDTLELRDGEIYLAGRTESDDATVTRSASQLSFVDKTDADQH